MAPVRRERVRLLGRALALGFALAALAVAAVVAAGRSVRFASEQAFAVSALVLGFSVLGWSGSVFAGRAVENLQEHLGASSDWTEADSRRAMTVLGCVGAGGMVGASLATWVLASLL